MVEIVDSSLLKELCQKHRVPTRLAQKVISEFMAVETPKKNYIQEIIEEWDKYVDKKADT